MAKLSAEGKSKERRAKTETEKATLGDEMLISTNLNESRNLTSLG